MIVVGIEDMEEIVKNADQIVEQATLVAMTVATVTVVQEEEDINGIIKLTMSFIVLVIPQFL